MNTTDHNKQAENFLNNTGTTMRAEFCGYMRYFPNEMGKRNVWDITFTRNHKPVTFRFGDSIINSNKGQKSPSAYAVLSCLEKNDVGSIDDFATEYGYSTDTTPISNIINMYNDVVKEVKKVKSLWGDVMEELREIN